MQSTLLFTQVTINNTSKPAFNEDQVQAEEAGSADRGGRKSKGENKVFLLHFLFGIK